MKPSQATSDCFGYIVLRLFFVFAMRSDVNVAKQTEKCDEPDADGAYSAWGKIVAYPALAALPFGIASNHVPEVGPTDVCSH